MGIATAIIRRDRKDMGYQTVYTYLLVVAIVVIKIVVVVVFVESEMKRMKGREM